MDALPEWIVAINLMRSFEFLCLPLASKVISCTIFLLWLTCAALLAGITFNIMGPSRTATQLKAGCFTIVFLVIFFMGVFHGVEKGVNVQFECSAA
jgi:hypothetical protein